MTYEMEMIYRMASKIEVMTEEEFLQDAFDVMQGIRVTCADADLIAAMDGAQTVTDEETIYWHGMIITYDPYEHWDAEEI